jgi:hypothetical protein
LLPIIGNPFVTQIKRLPGSPGQNVAGCCHPVAENVATLIPDYQRCNGCCHFSDFIYVLDHHNEVLIPGLEDGGTPRSSRAAGCQAGRTMVKTPNEHAKSPS